MNTVRPRITPDENRFLQEHRAFLSSRKEEITIVLPCVHLPFQHREAMDGIRKLATDLNIDRVVWLGDAIDANALGDYERGKLSSTGITLEEEYEEANNELDRWEDVLREDAIRVYLFGNHENRYFRWQKSPHNAKYGELLSPIKGMNLEERGYQIIPDYRDGTYMIGDLELYHGELTNIHVSKKSLDTFRRNTMFAHTHRIQLHREGDYASYNIGSLANFNAPAFNYAPRSVKEKWANGFAVTITIDNKTHVDVVEVLHGGFYYGGKRY